MSDDDYRPIALDRPWHVGRDGKLHYLVDPGDGLCSAVDLTDAKILAAVALAWNATEPSR